MSKRRPRHLSVEERALWDRVAKSARAYRPEASNPTADPSAESSPAIAPPQSLPGVRINQPAKPSTAVPLSTGQNGPRMDAKAFGRMKRGKLTPEARIDLHGMTQAAAHGALSAFLLRAHGEGKRLVLVITGKGKKRPEHGPIPEREGILRHNVPHWLAGPGLRHVVLEVVEAHRSHGGAGAYYVYLRRRR